MYSVHVFDAYGRELYGLLAKDFTTIEDARTYFWLVMDLHTREIGHGRIYENGAYVERLSTVDRATVRRLA